MLDDKLDQNDDQDDHDQEDYKAHTRNDRKPKNKPRSVQSTFLVVRVPKPTRTPIAKQTMAMITRMSFALTCCTRSPYAVGGRVAAAVIALTAVSIVFTDAVMASTTSCVISPASSDATVA